MAKAVLVYLKPGVYTIVNPNVEGAKNKAKYTVFGDYIENDGHIRFVRDIHSDDGVSIETTIDWIMGHPRSAFTEIFPEVEFIDEGNNKNLTTLYSVDLIGILQGIIDYLEHKK